MKCQRKGCECEAIGAVQLNVPAVGYPAHVSRSARLIIGLVLCHRCFVDSKAQEFLTADPRLKVILLAQTRGKAPPDFDRAFLTMCSFQSEDWKALQSVSGGGRE